MVSLNSEGQRYQTKGFVRQFMLGQGVKNADCLVFRDIKLYSKICELFEGWKVKENNTRGKEREQSDGKLYFIS